MFNFRTTVIRSFLMILFLPFCVLQVIGQAQQNTIGNVTISSPTAASLGKFGDIPVSYHTGVPAVGVPLYTVQAGPIKLPIGLSYHASGLKVMEPAGWVGAGWALNAGGVITRTVQGQPDEVGANSGAQVDGHYTNNGFNSYLYNTANQQDWQGFAAGRKDGEPDLFFFNFGGYSGKFFFRDDRTPVIVPEQDIKIVPTFTGGRSFDYFTLTTPDGVQYVFGNAPGATGAAPIEITNSYSAQSGSAGFPPTSSWYLSRVISADDQFVVNLSYMAESYGYFTLSMFAIDGSGTGSSGILGYDLVKNTIQGVRLSKISFPNGTVTFNPGPVRTDLCDNIQSISDGANTSATSLGSIQISDALGYCKKYNFSYGYFSGDNTPLPASLTGGLTITSDITRLRLDNVQEVSCDGSIQVPPYKFSYYTPVSPHPNMQRRLSFGVDHWGYANGKTANTGLIPTVTVNGTPRTGADRGASWPDMFGGALTRIDYPTGGYNSFDFESNSGYVTSTEPVEDPLATIPLNYAGQSQSTMTVSFVSNGNPVNVDFETSCIWGTRFSISNSTGQIYGVEYTNSHSGALESYPNTLPASMFPPGNYTVTATIDGPPPYTPATGGVFIRMTQPDVATITTPTSLGGLRVKTITTSDGMGGNDIVTNYGYSGLLLYSQPTYIQLLRNDIIARTGYWTTAGFVPSPFSMNGCPGTGDYYISPGSLRPMASFDGSIMGYLTVTVSQTGNGRKVYNYSTPQGGYSAINNTLSVNDIIQNGTCDATIPNYPSAPLPYDPKRGQLVDESTFDEAGHLLKDLSYYYTYDQSPLLSTPAFIVTPRLINGGSELMATNYTINTTRTTSTQTVEQDFNLGGGTAYLTKQTTTYYGSKWHNQPTRMVTTTSAGDTLATNTKYVADLRLASCDAISDCSTEYNNTCAGCLTTYNSGISACGMTPTASCLTAAYLTYLQCNTNARTSYVTCRNTNYMGTTNAFNTCHTNAETTADNLLKPILTLQDVFLNAPVEVNDWKNTSLKHSSFIIYNPSTIPTGFAYPGKTQLISLQAISSAFSPAVISGSTISKDSRYLDEVSYQFSAGNPQQVTGHDGVPNAYIWDYLNQQPIAKVISATVDQVAATSFEADGNGSWTIASPLRDSSSAITGRRCYNLVNGSCQKGGLNTANTYTLSYWSKGGVYSVSGSVADVVGKTINGWTYHEHKVASVNVVAVTGSGLIDELRVYPASAQMTTYTYQPLLGLTSQCDLNNRISYYEYDNLGRLKDLKDQDGNVIKTMDYHYKGQVQ